ncbi:sodium channel subunit beta-2-like, partial [Clarias magur]
TAIVMWILAVSHMDSGTAESMKNMTVSVGKSVMLPCPCSLDTKRLVWQIGEEIVVNHCCEANDPINESYQTRTQVFMAFTKGNCSLLLHNVSLNDSKKFTCYIFENMNTLKWHEVQLTVEDAENHTLPSPLSHSIKSFSVGIPLSLMVLLAVLVVTLLIRRQRQKRPKM